MASHASSIRHIAIAFLLFGLTELVSSQRGDTIFPVSCFLNVMVVLDRSDSVLGGFNRSRDFVINVSEELNIGPNAHSVSMVVYSGNYYRQEIHPWNFAKNNAEFKQIVGDLRAIGGTTNTHKALMSALTLMETRNKTIPTLIMVVTDGRSAVDPGEPAKRLQEIPLTWVFAAATGDPLLANKQELLQIAGHPYHVVLQSGREEATDITRRLLREAQEKCKTTTTSTTTTTTTTTTNPFTGCEQELVLVMDFSTTTQYVYNTYLELAERLLRQLVISPRHTRVALVTFSSVGKTHTHFSLDKYRSADEVISEIKSTQYIGGLTAIGSGIKEGVKQATIQRAYPIDPSQVNKIMLVFTDGWNNKGPDPEEEAAAAVAAGFRMMSISVVDTHPNALPVNQPVLDVIVKNTHETFTTQNFDQLINAVKQKNLACL